VKQSNADTLVELRELNTTNCRKRPTHFAVLASEIPSSSDLCGDTIIKIKGELVKTFLFKSIYCPTLVNLQSRGDICISYKTTYQTRNYSIQNTSRTLQPQHSPWHLNKTQVISLRRPCLMLLGLLNFREDKET